MQEELLQKPPANGGDKLSVITYKCGGKGHFSKLCPSKNLTFCGEEEDVDILEENDLVKVLEEQEDDIDEIVGVKQVSMVTLNSTKRST